ncbi:MAG: CBS domain-containing protein [Methanomicrobiales archaeon]|nr:CBS domain-containing protein [Methanomicrobiales archaeon]
MEKSIDLINTRIRDGNARVVTAEEMPAIVDELGEQGALAEVDVVTTGTFGAMCSSGAFFNFGHSDPPIRMERVWLNDVEAYAGIAAVDAYLGATQQSETRGDRYGGAHVLEDLVAGNTIELRALSKGTDCYPRTTLKTEITLEDLNQAVMCNPRNSYQCYAAATNSSDRALSTYMGSLLPHHGNVSFSGAGVLSPLANDPGLRVIGSGTPIFLCGAEGMVIGEGTQSSPATGFGTLMVRGEMRGMSPEFLRAATFTGYGATLYVGLGVPIPVIDLGVVRSTAVRDEDITTSIVDYGVPARDRPVVRTATYAELRSGKIEIAGEDVRTSSLSSFRKAREVAAALADRVRTGKMGLALPIRRIDATRRVHPLRETQRTPRVRDIMQRAVPHIGKDEEIATAARTLLKGETNHLPVLDAEGKLVGIVTTYDISKAVVQPKSGKKVSDIMTRRVIRTMPDEAVDVAARKLEQHNISALPVVDGDGRLIGLLSAIDLGKLFGGRWRR